MAKKILIVEDDPGISEVMSIFLEEEGYEVKAIEDGSAIISEAISFKPKVIFMDLLISGTNGSELCRELKRNGETKAMKVVLMSAHPQAKEAALEGGADDFLAKPFEAAELIKVAKKYSR